MALINIAGTDIPAPTDYQVSIMDISRAERTSKGLMKIDQIATKRKLELSWAYLSQNNLSTILNLLSTLVFDVTYLDPLTKAYEKKSFYCGDRSAGMIDFVNGVPRYKDVKFNLIER